MQVLPQTSTLPGQLATGYLHTSRPLTGSLAESAGWHETARMSCMLVSQRTLAEKTLHPFLGRGVAVQTKFSLQALGYQSVHDIAQAKPAFTFCAISNVSVLSLTVTFLLRERTTHNGIHTSTGKPSFAKVQTLSTILLRANLTSLLSPMVYTLFVYA